MAARFARAAGAKPKPTPAGGDLGRGAEFTNFTVALERAQHRELRVWALDHRTEASAVVRALLAELEASPELAAKVAARVAAAKAQR
jgi:hypothetical protein